MSSQRTPNGPSLMRMRWMSLAFIHWPVPAATLRPLVPSSLEIDQFDGAAWVGLVPFTMRGVLPSILPDWPGLAHVPAISAFHECNVRTYVHPMGRPRERGVWFFSLDAASRIAVWMARRFFCLPYYFARIGLEQCGDEVRYAVDRLDHPRASLRCIWHAGRPLPPAQTGELADFLTNRMQLFAMRRNRSGQTLCRCRVEHEPWSLREGELEMIDDELVRAAGIEVSGRPIVHQAEELAVRAWPLEPV
jgi:uncharacterized protein YqjF (DUF2071 family)